jgi:hypothetical protein
MMDFKKSLFKDGPESAVDSVESDEMESGAEGEGVSGDIASQIEALKADFEQKISDLKMKAGIGGEEEEVPEEEMPEGGPAGEMGEPGLAKKKMPAMMISLGLGGKK